MPQHRGSVQVAYTDPRYVNLALGVQFVGRQFDDDLNAGCAGTDAPATAVVRQPRPAGYTLVDFTASRALGRNFEVFFGVQNLLDEEYYVGTLPDDDRLAAPGERRRAGPVLQERVSSG